MHKLSIALMALLALSCKDSGVAPADQPFGQVIFETEYVNWAWGYAYQGTVVFEDGADMGAIAYSVYRYDSDSAQYHKLVLRVDGDWTFYNGSVAAVALVSLMQRL